MEVIQMYSICCTYLSTVCNSGHTSVCLSACMIDLPSTASDITGVQSPARPPDLQFGSAPTSCEDPALHDHDYCKAPPNGKNVTDTMTQCDDVGFFMLQSDSDALLHTGLNLAVFNILVSTLETYASYAFFTMSVRDQVLMTLMKLKANPAIGVLSRQFHISQIMANKVILYWIDKLEEVLLPLVPWLPRETIKATMPESFKEKYPNTTCIMHCSVSRLQKPPQTNTANNNTRGASYSHYYNTVKYLVAVAPCGLIMFISAAYAGRCSDKFITSDSGILDHLMPGDEVMVDRGSNIKDLCFLEKKVKLITPSFTALEHACTCTCGGHSGPKAHVRVHVEKAVKRLKVYKILSQVVAYSMAPKINKILRICSALVNLRRDPIHDSH